MDILTQDKTTINHLGKASDREMSYLNEWLVHIEPYMFESVSTYAKGRKELHLRNFVKLASSKNKTTSDVVKPIIPSVASQYQSHMIEQIGERLLPGFHQGLVLYYPKGTLIKPHRDSPAYAKGAASINIVGNAKFLISSNQDATNMQATLLGEGDCIWFNNKQPHAIATVEEDRWCVCFFYLKELQNQSQKQSNQLALFPEVETPNPQSLIINHQFKNGDKIQYKHPKADGWVEAIFHEFYTPGLAPTGAKWSFIELSVKGKLFKAFSLNQIRLSA
ncbi:hypothetical protein Cl131_gp087 [Aphanizomenon phage vB_AphaS-CL131]|nr:hypothetical protein Cl131_gp087 [Aphanizomenon phage vB_AphaS-CL131]